MGEEGTEGGEWIPVETGKERKDGPAVERADGAERFGFTPAGKGGP